MLIELLAWYARHSRPLPWREKGTTPWGVLVCEIMSQQTPVVRVLPAWNQWMERWPTPEALAAASPAEVIVAWGKMGYPRRALRLHECAKVVSEQWEGQLPLEREDLLSLPGIGPYTADAVIAFAYHRRSVVLDTNTRRVICRLNGVEAPPSHLRKDEIARADALVPQEDSLAWQWNAALMELGALVCTSKNPACDKCPVSSTCRWLALGKPSNGSVRKIQAFTGTHREARGKIMAVLRETEALVNRSRLFQKSGLTKERFSPALTSLLSDGLIEGDDAGYSLPQGKTP